MSTSAIPETPQNKQPESGTSPSPAASGGNTPTAPSPEPFKFGDTAPEWARGKSAEEVLGIAQKMEGALRGFIQQGTAPVTPAQPQETRPWTNQYGQSTTVQPQYPPQYQPSQTAPSVQPDQWVTGADLQRMAPQMIQQAIAPQLQDAYTMAASANLFNVQQKYSEEFRKYGPEIDALISHIPNHLRTVDSLTKAVKFVLADHVDEIANERASYRIAEMGGNLRSNGSPLPSVAPTEPQNTITAEALPQDWKDRAARAGLTEQAVDEFCRENGITREGFFAQFGTQAITEVPKR